MTVWDLNHRDHPYFPEFNRPIDVWENAENQYRRLPRAVKVICGTQTLKEQIVHYYGVPPRRITVIPLATPSFALEAAATKPCMPQRFHSEALPARYLFYPAQFWAFKNHVGLFHALRILRDRHGIRLPVVFCGSDKGNLEHVHETAARLKLDEDVVFLGFVTREELVWLYRHAWALAYISFFGPDNLPPLEAFALGCPVIAANVEGAAEQLGDAALWVDPADAEGIADAIKRLSGSGSLRQELIARGHERARQFTARDYIREVFRLLDEFEPLRRCWS
jgi:glycosyltransferase involved in cell wall biosynthesis